MKWEDVQIGDMHDPHVGHPTFSGSLVVGKRVSWRVQGTCYYTFTFFDARRSRIIIVYKRGKSTIPKIDKNSIIIEEY